MITQFDPPVYYKGFMLGSALSYSGHGYLATWRDGAGILTVGCVYVDTRDDALQLARECIDFREVQAEMEADLGRSLETHELLLVSARLKSRKQPHPKEQRMLNVNDILRLKRSNGGGYHVWRVEGVYLGAVGQESLIALRCLSDIAGQVSGEDLKGLSYVPESLLELPGIERP